MKAYRYKYLSFDESQWGELHQVNKEGEQGWRIIQEIPQSNTWNKKYILEQEYER